VITGKSLTHALSYAGLIGVCLGRIFFKRRTVEEECSFKVHEIKVIKKKARPD
jgi:hypothetical protein